MSVRVRVCVYAFVHYAITVSKKNCDKGMCVSMCVFVCMCMML